MNCSHCCSPPPPYIYIGRGYRSLSGLVKKIILTLSLFQIKFLKESSEDMSERRKEGKVVLCLFLTSWPRLSDFSPPF